MDGIPKRRITRKERNIIVGIGAVLDAAQFVLEWFVPVVGIVINEIIDIIVDVAWLLYLVYKKVHILKNGKRLLALVATIFGKFIPVVQSAPLWCLDFWYTIHTVIEEDDQAIAAAEARIAEQEAEEQRQFEAQQAYQEQYLTEQAAENEDDYQQAA